MFGLKWFPSAQYAGTVARVDPRGGSVPDVSSSMNWNNMHTPYRGRATDFAAPANEGDGRPTRYIQSMPGLNAQGQSQALAQILQGILRRQTVGLGGQNVQVPYRGISFGVITNG
jgi:hypothetical protein